MRFATVTTMVLHRYIVELAGLMEQRTKLHHVVLLCSFQQLDVGWHTGAKPSFQNAETILELTASLEHWMRRPGPKAPSEA